MQVDGQFVVRKLPSQMSFDLRLTTSTTIRATQEQAEVDPDGNLMYGNLRLLHPVQAWRVEESRLCGAATRGMNVDFKPIVRGRFTGVSVQRLSRGVSGPSP